MPLKSFLFFFVLFGLTGLLSPPAKAYRLLRERPSQSACTLLSAGLSCNPSFLGTLERESSGGAIVNLSNSPNLLSGLASTNDVISRGLQLEGPQSALGWAGFYFQSETFAVEWIPFRSEALVDVRAREVYPMAHIELSESSQIRFQLGSALNQTSSVGLEVLISSIRLQGLRQSLVAAALEPDLRATDLIWVSLLPGFGFESVLSETTSLRLSQLLQVDLWKNRPSGLDSIFQSTLVHQFSGAHSLEWGAGVVYFSNQFLNESERLFAAVQWRLGEFSLFWTQRGPSSLRGFSFDYESLTLGLSHENVTWQSFDRVRGELISVQLGWRL